MIRRAALIVLALATVLLTVFWIDTSRPGSIRQPYRDYSDSGSVMGVIDDGQIRLSHWRFGKGTVTPTTNTGEKFGFGFYLKQENTPLGTTLTTQRVWFPAWWAFTVLAALPLLELALWLQRKIMGKPRHLCPHCEYSLIGLVSPRCPECGNEVEVPTEATAGEYVDPTHHRRVRFIVTIVVIAFLAGGSAIMAFVVSSSQAPAPAPPPPPFMAIPQRPPVVFINTGPNWPGDSKEIANMAESDYR